MTVNPSEFKQALACWASGVTIVTTLSASEGPLGMTASAFSSVSAEPPIVLVCINKSASSCPVIAESGVFAVNILERNQEDNSNRFASFKDKEGRWENLDHSPGATGSPLLNQALASLDCKVINAVEAGTHIVYFGQVEHVVVRGGNPLVYFKGAYRSVDGL